MLGYSKKKANKEFEQNEEYYQEYVDYYAQNLNVYQKKSDIFLTALLILGLFSQFLMFGWTIEVIVSIGLILLEIPILLLKYQRNTHYYSLILFNYYFIKFFILFNIFVVAKYSLYVLNLGGMITFLLAFIIGWVTLLTIDITNSVPDEKAYFPIKTSYVENKKLKYIIAPIGSLELESAIRFLRRKGVLAAIIVPLVSVVPLTMLAGIEMIEPGFIIIGWYASFYIVIWSCFTRVYMTGHIIEYLYHKYKKSKHRMVKDHA